MHLFSLLGFCIAYSFFPLFFYTGEDYPQTAGKYRKRHTFQKAALMHNILQTNTWDSGYIHATTLCTLLLTILFSQPNDAGHMVTSASFAKSHKPQFCTWLRMRSACITQFQGPVRCLHECILVLPAPKVLQSSKSSLPIAASQILPLDVFLWSRCYWDECKWLVGASLELAWNRLKDQSPVFVYLGIKMKVALPGWRRTKEMLP